MAQHKEKVQLAISGNLKLYRMKSREGKLTRGDESLCWDGSPVAYASWPWETVNYVSAHDNETLFDILLIKSPPSFPLESLCRLNHLAVSIIALQQGVAFFHCGDELLRSKSLDRDSYNSGDWFNRLDFSYQSNNFGVGLPPFEKNGEKWDFMRKLLENPNLKPSPSQIMAAVKNLQEFLKIRYSSPLFRLRSVEDINARLEFLNVGPTELPGVIVMTLIDGGDLPEIDPLYSRILVVFNAREDSISLQTPFDTSKLELHPVQLMGNDQVVKLSSVLYQTVNVPGLTTAVFVERKHKKIGS